MHYYLGKGILTLVITWAWGATVLEVWGFAGPVIWLGKILTISMLTFCLVAVTRMNPPPSGGSHGDHQEEGQEGKQGRQGPDQD